MYGWDEGSRVGAAVIWECAVVAMANVECRRGGDVAFKCWICQEVEESSLDRKDQSFYELYMWSGNRIPQA